ncbi:MAG: hypothetical protein JWO48_1086 [Bryobacterales bacterium]|nr:hypothetical protein [Bryobacterales bacterium]
MRGHLFRPGAGIGCLLVLALTAQQPIIRTTVPLVVVPTAVTDSSGEYIHGLTASDFLLRDNGTPQNISVDEAYVPISLVLAIQSSEIAAPMLAKIHKVGSMIEPLLIGERGEAAIVSFDDSVTTVQNFTSDADSLTMGMRKISAGGQGSRMIDAVAEAVKMLAARQPPNRHRAIIVLGEKKDRGSKRKLEDVVTLAQRENVAVYPLTYSAFLSPFTVKAGDAPAAGSGLNLLAVFSEIARMAKTNAADALSKYTGGWHLSFLKQKALEEVIARIGEELHNEYLLSFTPATPGNGEFHEIRVEVRGRPQLAVRARPGYWEAGAQ